MAHETVTKPSPAEPLAPEPKSVDKKQISAQEIVEALKSVRDDVEQINKLTAEEEHLVEQLFASLQKHMHPLAASIDVSTSVLPIKRGEVTQARIHPTGHLVLTFKDRQVKVEDLSEAKNRDLLMAAVDDAMPKFINLASRSPDEKVQEPPQVLEGAPVELLPAIKVDTPVGLAEADTKRVQEEAPQAHELQEQVPVLSAEENVKIAEVTAETLGNLEQLGSQVFEHSPVSVYFDDWVASLRQVILECESSGAISADELFTKECAKIFSDVEGELAKGRLEEAELEASAKTLSEDNHLLAKIEAEYAAQIRDLVVKGKSVIDFLTKTVQDLEEELAKIEQIKTSYLHPFKKRAKEQRRIETTEKLNTAKKRLALAVQHSAVEQKELREIDAEYAAQTSDLAAKRKSVIDYLTKNVHDLERELTKIRQTKTSNLHPLKKKAKKQKQMEVTQKLDAAKKRLALAKQNSGAEQKKLHGEYEKKKQATILKMQRLEKEIADKEIDRSFEARQAAATALANAVKALVRRKTVPSQ